MSLDPAVILQALDLVLQPWNVMLIVFGVLLGIVFGTIPGLTAALAIALLLPFTFAMEPREALSLLVAVYVGGLSGSCITAILIRMPGTPASVATLLDGFPMAQKGLAGQAIGNAVVASFFGTVISGIFLVLLAPLMAAFAIKFHFAEYVAVSVFALTAVAALTGSKLSRGLVTGLLGMLAATFGVSEEDGLPRFDFGEPDMLGGFSLIPALIGLFAISQMMHETTRLRDTVGRMAAELGRVLPTLRDVRSNIANYLRSGIIGTFVGVLPAVGGGPAGLIAYAQARNASKTPERFGTGTVEGVISAETANNATIGGALIIALTLGIPGDPPTAVLLGGLMIHGLEPGPFLFLNHPEIIYSIYFSVFFGSLVMALFMLSAARLLARIADAPKHILLPMLFIVAATGVFSMNHRLFDVFVMCGFGLLGYVLERFSYPLPPFILGMILGPLVEGTFRKMVGAEGDAWNLFTKPISATFLALAVAAVIYSIYRSRRRQAVLMPSAE